MLNVRWIVFLVASRYLDFRFWFRTQSGDIWKPVLLCSCNPVTRDAGGRGTIVALFSSLIFSVYTTDSLKLCIWTFIMGRVKGRTYLPEVQILLKELFWRIESPSCISYLFIYWLKQTLFIPRRVDTIRLVPIFQVYSWLSHSWLHSQVHKAA